MSNSYFVNRIIELLPKLTELHLRCVLAFTAKLAELKEGGKQQ